MRKMDEMESSINQIGIKWSWFFTVLSLFIWGGFSYYKSQEMSIPMILLIMQFLVYFVVTSIAKSKVDDNSGKKQILSSIGILVLLIAFGLILYFNLGH